MYVKIHHSGDKVVIAICGEELVGKKISEGELVLDISERFYKGEKKSKEEVKKILENAENINLVGEKAVKFAKELGILNKESIVIIRGIPHAQIIVL